MSDNDDVHTIYLFFPSFFLFFPPCNILTLFIVLSLGGCNNGAHERTRYNAWARTKNFKLKSDEVGDI